MYYIVYTLDVGNISIPKRDFGIFVVIVINERISNES